MSRIANLLTLSLIAALALAWGWVLTTAFAGESNPDDQRRQLLAQVSPQTGSSFTATADEPGLVAQYTITFTANADYTPGRDNLVIELDDFGFPGSISSSAISITPSGSNSANPQAVTVDGEKLVIALPDFDPATKTTDADADKIDSGESVTVTIRRGVGLRTPTECGDYPAVISGPGPDLTTPALTIRCVINLSAQEGRRGTHVTATGKGFKNGTSLGFFLDADTDGVRDIGEVTLCDVAQVGSNDTGSCKFTVNNPPFLPGDNFINAVDGRGQHASTTRHSDQKFVLLPDPTPTPTPVPTATPDPTPTPTRSVPPASVALSATSGAPGTVVTVRGEGFKSFVPVTQALVGAVDVTIYPLARTDAQGSALFDIRIPNLYPGSFPVEVRVGESNVRATFTVTAVATPTPTPVPTATPRPTPTATPYPSPVPTATAATPTPAPAAPQLIIPGNEPPHLFIGRAMLNGNAAGVGVSVQAYDGGKLIGATVTQAGGTFTIHVHRSAGVITFRVNNQAAAESWASWSSGQANHGFNLTAGGSRGEDNPSRLFAALPDLVRAFTFDNATKGWNFFDPLAADVSTLTRFMPQHSYWLLVSRTTWLMLNGVERQLTCVEGNCWNLIVW